MKRERRFQSLLTRWRSSPQFRSNSESQGPTQRAHDLRVLAKPTYKLGEEISSGATATVYVAKKPAYFSIGSSSPRYEVNVAAKVCDLPGLAKTTVQETQKKYNKRVDTLVVKQELHDVLVEEVRILKLLRGGENIMRLVDAFEVVHSKKHEVWIVTEKLQWSLYDLIGSYAGAYTMSAEHCSRHGLLKIMPFKAVVTIIHNVLKALRFMNERRVVHLDIKPENILVSTTGNVKVCDFGSAAQLEEGSKLQSISRIVGTPGYAASEVCLLGEFDCSADIWSVGVVLARMVSYAFPVKSVYEDFEESLFDDLKASTEQFNQTFFNLGYLNEDELDLYVENQRGHRTPKQLRKDRMIWKEERHIVKHIARIVKHALVPYPKFRKNRLSQTHGRRDRLSLEDFEAWCDEELKGLSELKKLHLIMRCVHQTNMTFALSAEEDSETVVTL